MRILGMIAMLMVFMSLSLRAETVQLNESNTVYLKDVVYSESVTQAMAELAKRESNEEPVIYLVLDTPGGSVFAGLNLIHYLKGYKKPVKTITTFAASMGFQIAQGNPGDRLIVDTGVLMSHPMSGGMGGEIGEGLSLDNRIGYIKEVVKTMDAAVVARTKGKADLASYQKAYDNELWTTGQQAVDKGYADAVTQLSCSPELTASVDHVNIREWIGGPFAIEIEYETSKCPMMIAVLKYQIRIVFIPTEKKFILENSGYDMPAPSTDQNSLRQAGIEASDIKKVTEGSTKLKNFKFFLKRDVESVKAISWL
jgi:ATP-dependent Clp protease, protease subunit